MSCLQTFEAQRKQRLIRYWMYKSSGFHNQNFQNTGGSKGLSSQNDQLQKLCQILQRTSDNTNTDKTVPEHKEDI